MMTPIDIPRRRTNHMLTTITTNLRGIVDNLFPSPWLWLATLALIVFDYSRIHNGHKFLVETHSLWLIGAYPLVAIPAAYWLSLGDNAQSLISRPVRFLMLGVFLTPTMPALAVCNYIAMANTYPLTHQMLANWDRALGLNWLAYVDFIGHHSWLSWTLLQAYNNMIPTLLIVMGLWIIQGKPERCTELVSLTFFLGLITITIGSFFPANSAMAYLGTDHLKSMFPPETGTFFVQDLMEVRGSIPKLLDPLHTQGITQFPSFHTVGGILTIYGARGAWWSLGPAIVFSSLLIAATPVYGGHYFVDLIAGAAIAFSAIAVSQLVFMRKTTVGKNRIVNLVVPA